MRSKWWIPKFVASTEIFTLWHVDPCKKGFGGSDDSCGWFMRAMHGDKKVLEAIIKAYDFDWDRVFKTSREDHDAEDGKFVEKVYPSGYFFPHDDGGMPTMGVTATVLNLFLIAANEHFKVDGRTNWKKSRRWMQKNLFDIMLFAENPHDSLRDSIIQKWGNETKRDERIRNVAATIYGWILRETRPWYRHPRFHVHHWKIQIRLLQMLKRAFIERCAFCGKGFKWNESVYSGWSGTQIWHEGCNNKTHVDQTLTK